MDDVVNRFARELADAIAAAVPNNAEVEACRERARAGGLRNESDPRSRRRLRQSRVPPGRGAAVPPRVGADGRGDRAPQAATSMTANDRRFLRSLRIAADEAKVEETN